MISFCQGGFPSRPNHYLGTASGSDTFRAIPDFGTHTHPAARPGIWGGVWGLGSGVGSGVWGLGCFLGKRFLHDWASERRSRRATTGKRLVRTSRIFFVFMGQVRNLRNPFSVENPNPFYVKKSASYSVATEEPPAVSWIQNVTPFSLKASRAVPRLPPAVFWA